MIKKKIFILLFFFLNLGIVNSTENIKIVYKVNNKIITNVDINNEYSYLSALNKNFQKLKKDEGFKIAEESLIREMIKKNEIQKNFIIENFENKEMMENILENFYLKLDLQNISEFELYLDDFNISLNEVIKKIKIELLWNQLIVRKFSNQININEKAIKTRIKENKINFKDIVEFDLSEIIFQAQNQNEFNLKKKEIEMTINTLGFNLAANKFSLSDTGKFGGQIGKIREDQLSKKVLSELSKIQVGEFTAPVNLGNSFMILKINEKKLINYEIDEKVLLKNMIDRETKEQFENFSQIYFNKIKLNSQINEK